MFDGVAVNVTFVPSQMIESGEAEMKTVGFRLEFTDIKMILDEAMGEVRQVPPVAVISQMTTSSFASEVVL